VLPGSAVSGAVICSVVVLLLPVFPFSFNVKSKKNVVSRSLMYSSHPPVSNKMFSMGSAPKFSIFNNAFSVSYVPLAFLAMVYVLVRGAPSMVVFISTFASVKLSVNGIICDQNPV